MSDWADDAAEKLAETWCTGHVALVDVVAAELRAAEERGRRRGVEERDELRTAMLRLLRDGYGPGGGFYEQDQRLAAAVSLLEVGWGLAPRVPHASEGPPCAGCGHPKWQHQYGSKERAFCCAPLDELQRDYCRCKNYLAPRDSGKEGRTATLFDAIAHGDDKHRSWLKQAIEDHFAGRPVLRPDEVTP